MTERIKPTIRGWVYFALAGDKIKIGHSRRLAKRIQVLRSSSANGAELLGVMPGDEALEWAVQDCFADLREHGEWFRDDVEIRDFIKEFCDPIEARRALAREWAGVANARKKMQALA